MHDFFCSVYVIICVCICVYILLFMRPDVFAYVYVLCIYPYDTCVFISVGHVSFTLL